MYFYSTYTVKVVNGGLTFRRGLPPAITSSRACPTDWRVSPVLHARGKRHTCERRFPPRCGYKWWTPAGVTGTPQPNSLHPSMAEHNLSCDQVVQMCRQVHSEEEEQLVADTF
jgi:hypothetical protein